MITKKIFWGQYFIQDINIIKYLIFIINPNYTQPFIEIGPGYGALTIPIINKIKFLTVIEIDWKLIKKLTNNFFINKLYIYPQNILNFNYKLLYNKFKKKLRIFGNIPYNISSLIILNLLKFIKFIQDIHLLLPIDIVKRIMAYHNTKEYSRLTIITQYYCKIIPILYIPSKSFFPIPKIKSMFIKFIPINKPPFIVININKLANLTKLAFNKRRKNIKKIFLNLFSLYLLNTLGINLLYRAENISIKNYFFLANLIN